MRLFYECSDVQVWQGDSREAWQHLPEQSVDAIVTSPPYFGLRDYGHDGQIGLEPSPDEYVNDLADLLTGYGQRVLKPGGSLWLNLGDSYSTGTGAPSVGLNERWGNAVGQDKQAAASVKGRAAVTGMPAKCLLMIPERVALALISRGWILRNRVVWAKPNGMPSSVRDRLATKHEALFHLVRQPRYYYDLDAIREPHAEVSIKRNAPHRARNTIHNGSPNGATSIVPGEFIHSGGKNPGDVWTVPTQPYPDAHFAVFPPELVRRPILATVPEQVCKACGTARQREMRWDPFALDMDRPQARRAIELVKRHNLSREHLEAARSVGMHGIGKLAVATGKKHLSEGSQLAVEAYEALGSYLGEFSRAKFVESGWSDCGCGAGWTPGTVLDPFFGSGTTGVMARRLGRKTVGVELSPDYCQLAANRFRQDVLNFDGGAA
jgi:DNA modification methylase